MDDRAHDRTSALTDYIPIARGDDYHIETEQWKLTIRPLGGHSVDA